MIECDRIFTNQEIPEIPRWQRSGLRLAEYFSTQENPILLLDQDGVVMQGDSFYEPKLLTPDIIPALLSLEAQGVKIGTATARGMHIMKFLTGHGLALEGPCILEEGHLFIYEGRQEYIALPEHTAFIAALRDKLAAHVAHEETWDEVKAKKEFAFCQGNEQWQGQARSSFWYAYEGPQEHDMQIMQEIFQPIINAVAIRHGLNPQNDIYTHVTRMKVDNLAIVSVKGKFLGEPVDKSIAVKHFMETPWAFAADGEGDLHLAQITKQLGGFVLGIEGNLDISTEVPEFLNAAHARHANAQEFAQALHYTAYLLANK